MLVFVHFLLTSVTQDLTLEMCHVTSNFIARSQETETPVFHPGGLSCYSMHFQPIECLLAHWDPNHNVRGRGVVIRHLESGDALTAVLA